MLRQVQPSSVARATFTLLLLMLGLAGCKPENQTCTDHNSCLAEGEMCVRGACCSPEDPDADQLECAPTLEAECGNGTIDPGETCDGDCPTTCDDDNRCTIDTLTGSPTSCDAACTHQDIEDCKTEPEPEELCGNGTIDPGETCDGDCRTSCDDGDQCTTDALTGSESTCDAVCTNKDIEDCTTEPEPEPEPEELCGNGTIDPEETCDGDCPATCDDGDKCTTDALRGVAASCDAVCTHEEVEFCTTNPDPTELCGNGKIDAEETCDGDCPANCDDDDLCTMDTMTGAANTCTATCESAPVSGCATLVSGSAQPTQLLLGNNALFWSTQSTRDDLGNRNQDGRIDSMSLDTGSRRALATAMEAPRLLNISQGSIFLTDATIDGLRVHSLDPKNSTLQVFETVSDTYSATVTSSEVYWLDGKTIRMRPLDRSLDTKSVGSVDDIHRLYTLMKAGDTIYLATDSSVEKLNGDGTFSDPIQGNLDSYDLIIDTSGVYVVGLGTPAQTDLTRYELDGSRSTTLALALDGQLRSPHYTSTTDDTHVFVSVAGESGTSLLYKVPKVVGETHLVAELDGFGDELVVDDNYIYWIVDNSILRIDKCADGPCCALDGSDDDKPECQPEPEELCGNGKLDAGETCDGDCPSSCDDDDLCTTDALSGAATSCTAACETSLIEGCSVLTTQETPPTNLVLDSTHLYWSTSGSRDQPGNVNGDGYVSRLGLSNLTTEIVVTGTQDPKHLTMWNADLYFVNQTAGQFEITRWNSSSRSSTTFHSAQGGNSGLVVGQESVYWVSGSTVWRQATDQASPPTAIFVAQTTIGRATLSYSQGSAYLLDVPAVLQLNDDGSTPSTVLKNDASGHYIDSTTLYHYYEPIDEGLSIASASLDGTNRQTLAIDAGPANPRNVSLTSDATHLYVQQSSSSNRNLSVLFAIPKSPGTLEQITSIDGVGGDIAADDNYIYWIVDNSIVRIEK